MSVGKYLEAPVSMDTSVEKYLETRVSMLDTSVIKYLGMGVTGQKHVWTWQLQDPIHREEQETCSS